jgi:two-component system response regulator YesN
LKRAMYKILVVDDEKLLRQGLIHLTNWAEHGYMITGEAANGVEALQFIKANRPDMVITDIVMPVMNGIDFIKKLRENGDSLPVIIASSYSEFQYVREALQLGAVDYLLKPEIDPPGLLQVLERAKSKVEQNPGVSGDGPSRDEMYLEQLFLNLLISDSMDKGTFFSSISQYNLRLSDENLQLILLCPERAAGWPDVKANYPPASIKKTIRECFHPEWTPFIFFSSEGIITLVLNASAAQDRKVETACLQVVHQISSPENGAYVAVLSQTYCGIEKTREIYNQTLPVAQFRFYGHSQSLLKAPDYKENIEAPVTDYKQLAALLETFAFEGLYDYIEDYIDSNLEKKRYFDPYELKKMLTEVFNYLLFYLSEQGLELTEVKEDRFHYIKMIENARSMPELLQGFKNITDKVAEISHQVGANRYSELITGVMKYIHGNFSENISLSTAASRLHVNKNYLCELFKKQTGENFSDYLTKVRLDQAKEMLKTGRLSIAGVGERVGYPNPSYFVQLFKKRLGMTPLEYRNLYQK